MQEIFVALDYNKQMKVFLVFPHQLFPINDIPLTNEKKVLLLEHPFYINRLPFHKSKLVLHRASMKAYEQYLLDNQIKVEYVDFSNVETRLTKLSKMNVDCVDPIDQPVRKMLQKQAKKNGFSLKIHQQSPMFLLSPREISDYREKNVTNNNYVHADFYKYVREHLDVLVKNGQPSGGKWSFDKDNRKPFPKGFKEKFNPQPSQNTFVAEAKKYVDKHFKAHFGDHKEFFYPITHAEAKVQLKEFLKQRFDCFGPYQDAVSKNIDFGCHSVMSSCLNIGIITPKEVLNDALEFAEKNKVAINSLEGFVRQLIGWREYIRMIYHFHGDEIPKMNYMNHTNPLPKTWFTGKTNIEPIDYIIQKLKRHGYSHHIERLMYTGNLLLLLQVDPMEAYRWFMVCHIDSYDWVMFPNVHGMTQFALEPSKVKMMTRPYFSSSNYIHRMSDFGGKGKGWSKIWHAIYYAFIEKHKTLLKKNYATSRSVYHWENKSTKEQKELLTIAKKYLQDM